MADNREQYIAIGKIVNTQGYRGEVRVIPLTDFPERFSGMRSVLLEQGERMETRVIEKTHTHGKFMIIKFAGVDDLNTAQTLKNAVLMVTRDQLTPLPEGSYYIFDIVGLEVYTAGGRYLGRVKDVLQTGANDVYMVEGVTPRPLLIPALKKVVLDINITEGKMMVELPEGLED